eukprot:UN04851
MKLKKQQQKATGNTNNNNNNIKAQPPQQQSYPTTFKNKETGKQQPCALTYKVRLPTIFYPLFHLTPTTTSNNNNNRTNNTQNDDGNNNNSIKTSNIPSFVQHKQNLAIRGGTGSVVDYPILTINIAIELQVTSSTTILDIYNMIKKCLSPSINNYILPHMGEEPTLNGGMLKTTQSTPEKYKNETTIKQLNTNYPFILTLSLPPQPIAFTAAMFAKQVMKYPLLGATPVWYLNIAHRTALSFAWRNVNKDYAIVQKIENNNNNNQQQQK